MIVSLKSGEGRPDLVAMGQAAVADEITFEMPSEQRSLAELIDILKELLGQTSLATPAAKDLQQAVVEMAGNAMEWGHRFRPELCVEITYRVRPDAITVRVRDHGPGFNHDPLNLLGRSKNPEEHRALFEATLSESPFTKGFGIMLTRGLTDEFFYNDAGNEVTLVKRLSASS